MRQQQLTEAQFKKPGPNDGYLEWLRTEAELETLDQLARLGEVISSEDRQLPKRFAPNSH